MFGTNRMNPSSEWGVLPLLLVPWGFAFYFLAQHRRPTPPVQRGDVAIVDALKTARNAIRAKRRNLKVIGGMFLIFLPVLALSISQLHATGKVALHELTSMVGVMGGVLALSALGMFLRDRLLLPHQTQLEAVLRQFEPAETR